MVLTNATGKIFDIQGYSVHDGPGNRTTVFMQGCTLNCFWCSNPEGINRSETLLYDFTKCILCKKCMEVCPNNAVTNSANTLNFKRDICMVCDHKICLETCYTDALRISGRIISVDELFKIIKRDRSYWGDNGGITLSGGEPLLQPEFAQAILKKCFDAYIHTAIETCGHVPWKNFERVIDYIDWIFLDIKHLNSQKHNEGIGSGNKTIIANVKKLSKYFKGELIFRFPLIPGYNDSELNLEETARLIKHSNFSVINVLPLHHLGRDKYRLLNKEYTGLKYKIPDSKDLNFVRSFFESRDLNCYIGNETPF